MENVIELLLKPESMEAVRRRETAELRVKRLSEALGADFTVKLRGLSFNQFDELRDSSEPLTEIVLAGLVEPNLRDPRLLESYGVPTPAELLKALFLPGELAEMRNRIDQLTGFRRLMLEEVKKN